MRIPAGVITAGPNTVRVKHAEPKSAYLLAEIHLRSLPVAAAAEQEQAALWLGLAQRAFDERTIIPENLVTAGKHVRAIAKLAQQKDGVDQIASKAEALRREIDKEFAGVTERIWNDVAIAERIAKYDDAEKALEQLLRLYPDVKSAGNARVRQKMQVIKELKSL